MTRRACQPVDRQNVERFRTREGCMVEREDAFHERGEVIGQHITLWTELELEPPRRETVLRR